jgi:hypothetical protein
VTRRLLPLLILACSMLAVPASASAVNVAVAIGDQNASMFAHPSYKALGLKKTRYFIHWNAAVNPTELKKADDFVSAANAAGVKVLMHISTDKISGGGKLPSVTQYRSGVRTLVQRFRARGVTDWGVWNEANHKTQPTSKNPKRAAQFYKEFKRFSCRGCKVVALDILDQQGVESYIGRWMKAAGSSGRTAKIIGIHNYSEVNRRIRKGTKRYPGTARIIKAVRKAKNKRAKFWYTETGGVVNFGGSFPCDTNRPVSRTTFMFDLARKFDKDVERLYTYNWTGASCNGFDAGFTNADGTLRPAYATFKARMGSFKK